MTPLDKDLSRETTVKVEDREIQITLTEGQNISMKLKGMKSGTLEIPIGTLYSQLKGGEPMVIDEPVIKRPLGAVDLSSYKGDDNFLIPVHELRAAANVVADNDFAPEFEKFLADFIRTRQGRVGKKK